MAGHLFWALLALLQHALQTGAAHLRSTASNQGFRYGYQTHGQDWVDGQCSSRTRQSPIDFAAGMKIIAADPLYYQYQKVASPFKVRNNGHTYVMDVQERGYGGVYYENSYWPLLSLELKSFSEHTFKGVHYPLELQMMHQRLGSGAKLIISVPISAAMVPMSFLQTNASDWQKASALTQLKRKQEEEHRSQFAGCQQAQASAGAGQLPFSTTLNPCPQNFPEDYEGYIPPSCLHWNFNGELQKFLAKEPPKVGKEVDVPINVLNMFNPAAFVEGANYYEYAGSLTTPPCSEVVTWMVRSTPIYASDMQIAYLVDGLFRMNTQSGNYRGVMPLMDRVVKLRKAVNESPPPVPDSPPVPIAQNVLSQREKTAEKWSNQALAMSSDAINLVRNLDQRLRKAAAARNAVYDMMPPPPTTPMPATTPNPMGIVANAEIITQAVANAAQGAVAAAITAIPGLAIKEAKDAAREAVDTVAVGYLPGGGTLPEPKRMAMMAATTLIPPWLTTTPAPMWLR